MTRVVLAHEILAPEVVLPPQYFPVSSRAQRQPELRLMLAVLEDAVLILLRHAGDGGSTARRLVREVERWVETRTSDWPFSFENICAVLGFDAAAVRRRLRHIRTDQRCADDAGRRLSLGRRVAGRRHRVSVRRSHRGGMRVQSPSQGPTPPARRLAQAGRNAEVGR